MSDDQQPDATEEVEVETGDEADEQEVEHEAVASSDDRLAEGAIRTRRGTDA